MSLKPKQIRKELPNLLENDRDLRKRSNGENSDVIKLFDSEHGPMTKNVINLMQQRPIRKQNNLNKSPANSLKIIPQKEPPQNRNVLSAREDKSDLQSKHAKRYYSREIIKETLTESLIATNSSENAQMTSALLNQANNFAKNKMLLLPKRPQKNFKSGVGSNPRSRNAKLLQIKETLEVYQVNSRPLSGHIRSRPRPQSVQPKDKHLERELPANISPRIDANHTNNTDNLNRNTSNLLKKKNHRHTAATPNENKNKLPETPATKENLIKNIKSQSGREYPSIQPNKSPVSNTFPRKPREQHEKLRGSFYALHPRNLAPEFNRQSRTESNDNSNSEIFLTDSETKATKLHLNTELVPRARPSFTTNHNKDHVGKDDNSSSKLLRRSRVFRNGVSSAQSTTRNQSELTKSQQIDDVSFKETKVAEARMHSTSSYKRFVALMNDLDMSHQFRDVQKMLKKSRKGSLLKKVSWNQSQ